MGDGKPTLLEQPVPKALGPKSQLLRPGRAAATFPPAPGPLGMPDPTADPALQLERWLGLLVGPENADCAAGIIEALLLLGADVIDLSAALKAESGPGIVDACYRLFRDIVKVALSLPPRCLSDEHLAAVFLKVYEIVRLAQEASAPPLPIPPTGAHPVPLGNPDPNAASSLEIHQRIVELIQQIPDMEILEKYPGLAEQVTDVLMAGAQKGDLNTQVDILVTLLPNDALSELDGALNKPASELPGAAFIETLNDYDNQLGLNLIPDTVVEGPAVDLLIQVAGVTGLLSSDDNRLLLSFAALLRSKIAEASNRSALDSVRSFVEILTRPDSPRIQISPEDPDLDPIDIDGDRGHLQEHRRLKRWKVLAGIK